MNLIEQLGGYDQALGIVKNAPSWADTYLHPTKEYVSIALKADDGLHLNLDDIRAELLEYRRANNIFEAGDKIIFSIVGPHVMVYENNFCMHVFRNYIRHATDKETSLGRELVSIKVSGDAYIVDQRSRFNEHPPLAKPPLGKAPDFNLLDAKQAKIDELQKQVISQGQRFNDQAQKLKDADHLVQKLQGRIDGALSLIYKEKSKVECDAYKGVDADLIIGVGYELHLILKGEIK